MLRGTPFQSRTGPLCQSKNWRRWAGYTVAGSYELNHEPEYHAIRSAAALIDVSPLYKYRIRGPGALRLLNRVVTRDVARSAVGQVVYTPWCDSAGKVRDDGTLSRLAERDFRLTAAEPNLLWLRENAMGLDVTIEDESDAIAALALQGPSSRELLREITEVDLDTLGFFRVTEGRITGIPVTISRTGYTGDLGYELWVDRDRAEALWDALVDAGGRYGLMPAGMLALDLARVEASLLLIDVDYIPAHKAVIEDRKSSPFELGLSWTVELEMESFVGRAALLEEKRRSPEWRFRGLDVEWESLERAYGKVGLPPQLPRIAWRASVPVYSGGRQVGYATSGCWSPTLKKYIALAHLHATHAASGSELEIETTVEHQRRRAAARVVKTPFFDPGRKRA